MFLDFLAQNDPLGLLKPTHKEKKGKVRSVLLNNFEEIVCFYEENNREPERSVTDIKEFQLHCRLKYIREDSAKVKELRDFDMYGLLNGVSVSNISLEDILGNDPLNLLDGDYDQSIFSLNHVKKSSRISLEYISKRKFCKDFENYQEMFAAIHSDLEKGNRKLAVYHPESLEPGKFYVLGGILLYFESVDGDVKTYSYNSGNRKRYDGRTFCILDNGTTSDMLFRSLDKALQKDGYSITNYEEVTGVLESVNEKDKAKGFVYVLRSRHSKLKNVPDIYKIGSTTTSVTERIKNAPNESTYLYAGVDVVETYRCFNIGARELEDKLHTFFDDVRLNINIPDERGVVISPREWFCVNLSVISEAVDKIISGTISNYVYDPNIRAIIAKDQTNSSDGICSTTKDDDIYEDVIQVLNAIGTSMERKPSIYDGKDEEALRDTMLAILESKYSNISATGETFNHGGKTDILLKDTTDGHNVFIGECKFWHGKKHFFEAIKQLFDRYLTWRDRNTALIVFVKGTNFTSVLKSIREYVAAHEYFLRDNGSHTETSFSYIFKHPKDSQNEIKMEIMVFNFDMITPNKERKGID